ncbi:MAG: aminodeoxychorismate/anthranilate synthase component II [Bacteroidota bacterium]|nr:aminodeoxychorismate/anthranilate synthase component II [Bacteroidota bacterium]
MKNNLLIIDNYDSFTYNLVHYIEEVLGYKVAVKRNDKISLDEAAKYDCFILSPGPGLPGEAGILKELITRFAEEKRIFGVCLGMQAIAECFGAKLLNLNRVYHGVATPIKILKEDKSLFDALPCEFNVGRYHSWVVDKAGFPDVLEITSEDENGFIMSLRHKDLPINGVQFHPESILTEHGKQMIFNFLKASGF